MVSKNPPWSRCWRITIIVVLCCASYKAAHAEDDLQPGIERSLFEKLNQERAKRGLAELKWSDKLMQSARKHNERMVAVHMLSHQTPDEPVLLQRVAATGLRFNASAENIAYATDPDDLHTGWMHSEGHRKNILNPLYDSVGIGVLKAGKIYYATQNFARVTSEEDDSAAEERLATAFNKLRVANKVLPVKFIPSFSVQSAICGLAKHDHLDSNQLPSPAGAHGTIAFTASEPEDMPKTLIDLSADPAIKVLKVGTCYMATKTYPGGTYWFGIVY